MNNSLCLGEKKGLNAHFNIKLVVPCNSFVLYSYHEVSYFFSLKKFQIIITHAKYIAPLYQGNLKKSISDYLPTNSQ